MATRLGEGVQGQVPERRRRRLPPSGLIFGGVAGLAGVLTALSVDWGSLTTPPPPTSPSFSAQRNERAFSHTPVEQPTSVAQGGLSLPTRQPSPTRPPTPTQDTRIAQAGPTERLPQGYTKFSSLALPYEVAYPSSWRPHSMEQVLPYLGTRQLTGVGIKGEFFTGTSRTANADTQLIITGDSVAPHVTSAALLAAFDQHIRLFDNGTTVASTQTTTRLAGREAISYSLPASSFTVHAMFMVEGGRGWRVTLVGHPAAVRESEEVFKTSTSSFKLLPART